MPAVSEHANVYDTVVLILNSLGFQVWRDRTNDTFMAEKDGWDFCAESPVGLLGLVRLWEFKSPKVYKDYWWKEDGPSVYSSLPSEPVPYNPVIYD